MSDKKLNRLDDEQFEGVAGGYIFDANELEANGPWLLEKPYEVIDDLGDVVARFKSRAEAQNFASSNGYSTKWIKYWQVQKLREAASSDGQCNDTL